MTLLQEPPEAEVATTPELAAEAEKAEARRGLFHALPAYVYLIIFFALPLVIVFIFSFASRSATGKPVLGGWNLDSYARLADPIIRTIVARSIWLALLNTVLCLLIGYPFAYWIATRSKAVTRNLLLVLVLIPFWTNFLVRTYAWRVLLDSDGPVTRIGEATGLWGQMLFTQPAVFIGLLYGFLPFMVLPLYAAVERLDWTLVEGARDLYASGWQAFRKVTLRCRNPAWSPGRSWCSSPRWAPT